MSHRIVLLLATTLAATCLSACGPISSVTLGRSGSGHGHHHRVHGPPPHAPAHGHVHRVRDRHQGTLELVFDEGLGLYVVIELPDHYYHDGVYVRIEDGVWYASTELGGSWERQSEESLPPGLRKKYGGNSARGRKHNRGRHPAKHW